MSYDRTTDNFLKIIEQGIETLFYQQFAHNYLVFRAEFREDDLSQDGLYFRMWPGPSERVSYGAQYEERVYNFDLALYYLSPGDNEQEEYERMLSEKWSQFYYKFTSNIGYEPTTGYCWHNLVISDPEGLIWGFDEEESNVLHIDSTMEVTRTNDLEIDTVALGGGVGL